MQSKSGFGKKDAIIPITGLWAALLFAGCVSTPSGNIEPERRRESKDNLYKNIPVEVRGIPYEFGDIRGNYTIDYYIEVEHTQMSNSQQSQFKNFRINKFIFDFKKDGSLSLSVVYSHDMTPAGGSAYYPAAENEVHEWVLSPMYHQHLAGNCSLDRYDDIAISQGKLNEMKRDPSLKKVYDILLSCAEDMDYDYNQVGIRVRFVSPPPLLGVCDDYSSLLIQRLEAAQISGVSDIVKVSGQDHAWVTLQYRGRTLYLDATWFDGNNIDATGTVEHIPRKDPRNMTFDQDIFTNHGKHHLPD